MTVNNQNQVQQKGTQDLRSMIMKHTDMLKMALPKTITPERMARIAMTAITRNPKLGACSQESFFGALLTAAQLGLEVNTPLGHAYLIPYNIKGGLQCQFQIGYQGLVDLAYRSNRFKRIKAVVVHEGDDFNYSYGLSPVLNHIPKGTGNPTHVYALYEFINGGGDFEVWTWEQVIAHAKKYSQSYNASDSPWKSAAEEMAKKTVLRSLLKYAPKAVEEKELAEAISADTGIIEKKMITDSGNYEILTDVQYEIPEAGAVNQSIKQASEKPATPSKKETVKNIPAQNKTEDSGTGTMTEEDDQELNELWDRQQEASYDSPMFPM
ncbi:recombinase RecT [Treponema pedis]|uniref:recombinase RecT n=1 Tax=Treponema pedis TaxID=409322 RepID=UPI000427DC1F|nr:recombinase RecT [Treponema pedis]